MNDREQIPCYVGRLPCGCIVSAMVDDPAERDGMAKEITKFMRDCIKDGLTVDRATVGHVRQNFGCKCAQKQRDSQKALFA